MAVNASGFAAPEDRMEYLRAWVANFELSDFLDAQPQAARDGILFVRFNQWPERGQATHEEALRLALEEARFGGEHSGDKADSALYAAGDSVFIVEDFAVRGAAGATEGIGGGDSGEVGGCGERLFTPVQWLATRRGSAGGGGGGWARVMVLDLNGHFCVAVPHTGGTEGAERGLLLLNTTDASYLR